jgi:hypothetical protein
MKNQRKVLSAALIAMFAVLYILSMASTARTYPPLLNKAKQLGFPAQDCTYCHTTATGGEGHNARGKWLIAEKARRNAEVVDVAWLKDYKAANGKASSKCKGKKNAPCSNQTSTK